MAFSLNRDEAYADGNIMTSGMLSKMGIHVQIVYERWLLW